MVTAARDRLARTLRGDAEAAFSAELTLRMENLSLAVEGLGPVGFPVTPAKARKLASLGKPARFGRGEQTLTDPDVRDTWEIPKHLVRAEWNGGALQVILATVKEELGLPDTAELTADLHSLLVYEPNQFFLVHQDSEKDNSMIGTLVVTPAVQPYRGRADGRAGRGAEGLPWVEDGAVARRLLCRLPTRGSQGEIGLPDHAHLQPAAARGHQPPGGR